MLLFIRECYFLVKRSYLVLSHQPIDFYPELLFICEALFQLTEVVELIMGKQRNSGGVKALCPNWEDIIKFERTFQSLKMQFKNPNGCFLLMIADITGQSRQLYNGSSILIYQNNSCSYCITMTRHKKNNRYKHNPKPAPPPPEFSGSAEEILEEVIQIRQLLQKSKQRLRESEHEFGYLLSSKWLGAWKSYTGYDALTKDQNPEEAKGFGKKKPTSKINQDLLAKPDSKFIKVPETLLEYTYLNYPINEDHENEKDFIVVDEQLWMALQIKYPDAMCIRRPLRKRKGGQPYVDMMLHSFNFLIVGPSHVERCKEITEAQYQKILKRDAKDETLEKLFVIKRIRVPCIWNLSMLRTFMKEFIPLYSNVQDASEVQFWRMQNYLSFAQIRQNLCSYSRGTEEGVLGNPLHRQQEQGRDLDDFLKTPSVMLIVCGGIHLKRLAPPSKPSGYCQQCVQDKQLTLTCLCRQVFYCSMKCLYDDKPYHSKSCSQAYESDDDEEYKKKSVYVDTKEVRCGLNNLGNTCYMNSSLQCLTNLPWLFEYFSGNLYSKCISKAQIQDNKGIFIHKFAKFVKKLNESQHYAPYSLKAQISQFIHPFKGYSQHDANDFIVYLLNTLNDFTEKQTEDAAFARFISDNLIGRFKSYVICPECKIQSTTEDIYIQVSLPIKPKVQQKEIQYVKMLEWNRYEKGIVLVSDWKQICQQIGQSIDCRRFVGNQGGDLKQIIGQSSEQVYKKHKRENLVFYSYLKPVPNTLQVKFNLAYSRVIAGNEMKAEYGYPIILQLEKNLKLWEVYKTVAQMIHTQKEGLEEMQKLRSSMEQSIQEFKRKILEEEKGKQKSENEQTQTTENSPSKSEQMQKQGILQIEHKYNQQLVQLRYKIKFRLVVVTDRKRKKPCHYCGKKCSLCLLPFSITTSVSQFQKLGQSQLQLYIFLDEKIQIAQTYSKSSKYNQHTTLQECLEQFSKPQQLDEQNAWYCEACDMMRLALKQLRFCSYPKTLILQLKRFKEQNGKKVKNNEIVWYPQVLEIQKQGLKYRLSGVVVHEGSLDGGHYWAVCRKGDEYYMLNDAEVKKVGDYFQKGAYILMYEMM